MVVYYFMDYFLVSFPGRKEYELQDERFCIKTKIKNKQTNTILLLAKNGSGFEKEIFLS